MSGGALNHLFYRLLDSSEMEAFASDLGYVLKHLEGMGEVATSHATEDVRTMIASFDLIKGLGLKLAPVLRSVEWELSGDGGPEDVAEAVSQYGLDHDVAVIEGVLETVDDRFVFWVCPGAHTEQHVEWEEHTGEDGERRMVPQCVVCGVGGPAHVLA